jgi:catechol 2,3-dioxygenase-like lactoylglutathione lyase family enzyme
MCGVAGATYSGVPRRSKYRLGQLVGDIPPTPEGAASTGRVGDRAVSWSAPVYGPHMVLGSAVVEARIPTQDLARARAWYAEKLGLDPVEERDGGLRYEGSSGVFCLFASAGSSNGSFTQLAFYVDDIEAAVTALKARGAVFEVYPGCVDSIMDIEGNYPSKGSGERAAWFRDSEGKALLRWPGAGADRLWR